MFHSCRKDSDGCSHTKYDGVNYSAKVVKKSHMRKGYAIFLFGCVLFEEVVSCMQEVVSLREVFRLWRVTATK